MHPYIKNLLLLLGRILLTSIFIYSSMGKIMHFHVQAFNLANKGLSYPYFFLLLAIVFELGGGLLVLLGWFTRVGAVMLIIFTLTVSYVMHSFWLEIEPAARIVNMIMFYKNIALTGGLVYILAIGAGAVSLDWFRLKKRTRYDLKF